MLKKILFLWLLFFGLKTSYSQFVRLSVYSEVSIITAGPGNELFEAFGHSAIRIKDPVLNLDLVYNYGVFDFNAPNFYVNFVKGDMLYLLGRYPFYLFENSYKEDKRWVKAQVLNLTQAQKQAYFEILETNALPKNASYFYNPYFNNCATKLSDISTEVLNDNIQLSEKYIQHNETLRSLMLKEIPWNTWGAFGINLALGSTLDQIANAKQYLYLPDYIYLAFKSGKIKVGTSYQNLVAKETTLLDFAEKKQEVSIFNPLFIFALLALIGIIISIKDYKNKKRTKGLDFLLFFTTGLFGILIMYLWFFSNHTTAVNNFNFLWCFAPNFFVAFVLLKNKPHPWSSLYAKLYLGLLSLIPMVGLFGWQEFPKPAIPIFILLLVRVLFLTRYLLPFKK